MAHGNTILVLMGATGTGKSALALHLAKATPSVIINADAMQMVAELRTITARPSVADESQAEHALYGTLPASSPTSVALWLELVKPIIARAWAEKKTPVLVGGTGMYVQVLISGLSRIPPIPEDVRTALRVKYDDAPAGELHAALAAKDPIMAARLKPGDTQRLLRALEVIETTGTSLNTWQRQGAEPIFPDADYRCFYLDIPREILYPRIDARFLVMMEHGALEEVRDLAALPLPKDTPILRAHGVPELMAHLRGEMSLADAIAKAQQNTRNYAKRQMTWLRHQMPEATALADTPEKALGQLVIAV